VLVPLQQLQFHITLDAESCSSHCCSCGWRSAWKLHRGIGNHCCGCDQEFRRVEIRDHEGRGLVAGDSFLSLEILLHLPAGKIVDLIAVSSFISPSL
jgi:hypothetical protein